ncbi:MAG: hypothetical protein LBP76_03995 [Treponema sp.]|jgi:hypothetical protein|nr:hypothetical protein [Treponema sp.]
MERILARVTISGAMRGCGWRYTYYVKQPNGAWKYSGPATAGMYPNRANYRYSEKFEAMAEAQGIRICSGRPRRDF